MSIIEKAVDKLERARRKDAPDDRGAAAPGALFRGGPVAPGISEVQAPADPGVAAEAPQPQGPQEERTGRTANLDIEKLTKAGFITPRSVDTFLAEQCRYIKRRLFMKSGQKNNGGARNNNLIMISSALPGEGKTFLAINLAMSIAMERNRTVLLVDADVAKPDLCPVLGVEPGAGLMDLLQDPKLTLADVLVKTDVPTLTLLPAGWPTPHMSELLASEEMRRLTQELADRYPDRIVIFDSMPLLAKSGASVLGDLVGQIVLVVEAVRTSQRAVQEALKMLDRTDGVGLILNKSRERSDFRYPYGYYHYG